MTKYIIVHDPHSSSKLVEQHGLIGDYQTEIDLVTDWFIGSLFTGDETISFPFSRLCCDVERFIDDPAGDRGQGILYTQAIDGRPLRNSDDLDEAREKAMVLYRDHHLKLESAIERAISLVDVVLIDAHSFNGEQVLHTTDVQRFAWPYPDICLGFNDPKPTLIDELRDYFVGHGLTVALNEPFEGSLAPSAYKDLPNFTSVMIEVNKRLYLKYVNKGLLDVDKAATLKTILAGAADLIWQGEISRAA